MEIYKDLSTPASKEFEKLLNSQLSKVQIDEGKIIEGKINKITEKFVFLFIEGLKSEPVIDVNELKSMGLSEKIKIGLIVPLSGENFMIGDRIIKSIRMAVNKIGDERIEIIPKENFPKNWYKELKELFQ